MLGLSPGTTATGIGITKLGGNQVAVFAAAPIRWLKLGIEHRNNEQRLNDAY
jgi:Holliday junction resolvasome RuvABC endonuclease subunit